MVNFRFLVNRTKVARPLSLHHLHLLVISHESFMIALCICCRCILLQGVTTIFDHLHYVAI